MNLSQTPELKTWPKTHYIYIEKIGPFQETAQTAWQELHSKVEELGTLAKIQGYFSLYKIDPKRMVYRAGVAVDHKPQSIPKGMEYTEFEGGKYVSFTLVGSYAQLPEACGYAFKYVDEKKIPRREGFNIENYVNDPKTTPPEDCITEILITTT